MSALPALHLVFIPESELGEPPKSGKLHLWQRGNVQASSKLLLRCGVCRVHAPQVAQTACPSSGEVLQGAWQWVVIDRGTTDEVPAGMRGCDACGVLGKKKKGLTVLNAASEYNGLRGRND